ncbi:MAG: Ig-like domain-containing protein [Gammaproteobacteria bacterium]|nr:Ig-like domain-containing protein [Gammaproteobacteria bacterium]
MRAQTCTENTMTGFSAGRIGGQLGVRGRVAAALACVLAFACADEPTGPPGSFAVSVAAPQTEPFTVGDTLRLEAEVRDRRGEAFPGVAITWSSSDPRVASVDPAGVVTGVAPGTATITATSGTASGTLQLSVADPVYAVLTALYVKTGGGDWTNSDNWLSDEDLDTWYGVDTDSTGRVVGLDLEGNNLIGHIPPELGDLEHLRRLDLAGNRLNGEIPPELANLGQLEDLELHTNRLTGGIPRELATLEHLYKLVLHTNGLTGSIPPELGTREQLYELELHSNALSGGIPPALGNLENLGLLHLHSNALTGGIPAELGNLANLRELNLSDNALTGTIPPELGGLASVTRLWLSHNELSGPVPARLGELADLEWLLIGNNRLSGPLPLALGGLPLKVFGYVGTELCVPADASFRAWLDSISSHQGTGVDCGAPLSDRDVLVALYHATDGPNWVDNENWLSDKPLGEWYGVYADANGRVVALSLNRNKLVGPIPTELGHLAALKQLSLFGNDLSGRIPPEIGNLNALEYLTLDGNDLSDPIPAEIGHLAALKRLSLYGNDLNGRIPPEIGNLNALEYLELAWNAFSGPIPSEIGNLAALEYLGFYCNRYIGSSRVYCSGNINGPIPPEIGNLAALKRLNLFGNGFSGPIPSEIGDLTALENLQLGNNNLTGPIPPWIGRLSALKELDLARNRFSGPLPRQIGDLARLEALDLRRNNLTGPVPPEIGQLASLGVLNLTSNKLLGPVPPEFAGLIGLKVVSFNDNRGMAGTLPNGLTALRELEVLQASGTGLCAPSNPGFLAWLEGIGNRRIRPCVEQLPAAYLTQAVQSREFPVPLVAGERALLRVFPTTRTATSAGIPPVRAGFWVDGQERHVVNISGTSSRIPTAVDQASLAKSANAEIPGHVVQPGLEMVIEVDPQGTLDSTLLVAKRIPEDGRLAVDVRAMPAFRLTVIPFLWSTRPDSLVLETTVAMAEDPHGHELLEMTRTLLPVEDIVVVAHEPVVTSHNDALKLLGETEAIRVLEGERGYYMGTMTGAFAGIDGLGVSSGRSIFSKVDLGERSEYVIAHELGHNMSLAHAPCGTSGDPFYPYSDGSIGAWGYDFGNRRLVHPTTQDLMSYCAGPLWVSDYHFTKALRYRLVDESPPAAAAAADRSLLLWGGMSAHAVPYLEPAFIVKAPPALPDSAGEYQISGRTETGTQLFALRFAMPATADGDGSSSFAFVLPVRTEWQGNLASISLTGPGGSATLDGDSDIPVAILRNPQTGKVRGILRDPPPVAQAAADPVGQGVGTGVEVLFSRGIPSGDAWRR